MSENDRGWWDVKGQELADRHGEPVLLIEEPPVNASGYQPRCPCLVLQSVAIAQEKDRAIHTYNPKGTNEDHH